MKNFRKEIVLLIVLLVVFPLIYVAHKALSPKPGTGEDLEPQTDLHFSLVEQRMDGDTLVVTVRNCGSSSWKEKDWIRCAIFLDGADTGIRAHLKPGQTVDVGETVTFRFPDIQQSLNEYAQVGMVQETIAYFPEKKPVVVE